MTVDDDPGLPPGDAAWGVALADDLAATPRQYHRAGDHLFGEGDPSTDVFFVHQGLVKIVKTATDGKQAIVALLGAGGLVGEHAAIDGLPRGTGAVAATDVVTARLARRHVLAAVDRDGDVAREILSRFTGQLRSTTRDVLALATGDSVTLIAARLAELVSGPMFAALRSTDGRGVIVVEMPISQQELASWAGVSHRSAASALQELRTAGVITTGRLHVEVLDPAALAQRAAGPG